MKPEDRTLSWRDHDRRSETSSAADRRHALVREMVMGAILPGLLARKDAGVFDRGPNVVRLTPSRDDT